MLTRRDFLKRHLAAAAGLSFAPLTCLPALPSWTGTNSLAPFTKKARYYQKLPDSDVRCTLCPRKCTVSPGERGYCGVRENQKGDYYTLVYGNPCALHVDPIEKKPFFHVMPGKKALSFATAGCNLKCTFCQNWDISQSRPEDVQTTARTPAQAVSEALKSGAALVAGTYSEPTVFYEYMHDVAQEARKAGLKTAVVSSGYINPGPLRELCRLADAVKIDLKAFDDDFYRKICTGRLAPVLESLRTIKKSGTWLEIVCLIIPTLNDRMDRIKEMSRWIKKELGSDVPLHFSRFHPMYKLRNLPETPASTLLNARETAREAGLDYVYIGNLPGCRWENTFCRACGRMVIERVMFTVKALHLKEGKCAYCKAPLPGIWK